LRREAWIYAKALIYSAFGQFKNTRFSPLAPIFCTIECRFFLIKWRGFNGWGENMNYYLQNMNFQLAIEKFSSFIQGMLMLTILILAIINLVYIYKYWTILSKSKYRYLTIALTLQIFTLVFLMPLASDKLGNTINNLHYVCVSSSEIIVYYLIVKTTNKDIIHKNVLLYLSSIGILFLLYNSLENKSGSHDETIFLYLSILFTYSSLNFFKELSTTPEKFLSTNNADVFLQLALFLCNSLPIVTSLCHIGIRFQYPDFDSRATYSQHDSLGISDILHIFILLGYTSFFFYTTKAIKCIKQTFTSI
jgi:hypothetical protein